MYSWRGSYGDDRDGSTAGVHSIAFQRRCGACICVLVARCMPMLVNTWLRDFTFEHDFTHLHASGKKRTNATTHAQSQ
eukprot:1861418-Pleurochrysis_carterae.AAC.1